MINELLNEMSLVLKGNRILLPTDTKNPVDSAGQTFQTPNFPNTPSALLL